MSSMTSTIVYMLLVGGFAAFILIQVNYFLSFSMVSNLREKNSCYECGFSQLEGEQYQLSLRYFLLTVIFMVFDLELVLLLPFVKIYDMMTSLFSSVLLMSVLLILLLGTFYEWKEGSLSWSE